MDDTTQGSRIEEPFIDAATGAVDAPVSPRHAVTGPWWREAFVIRSVVAVLVTLLVAALVRVFLVAPFRVDSTALEPDVHRGDVVMGLKTGAPQRGEAVVFIPPSGWAPGGGKGVARVVGVAGDEVRCCDAQDRLVINGISLGTTPEENPVRFRVVVPKGRVFLVTTQPGRGSDSRCHLHALGTEAMVSTDAVTARLTATVWPFGHLGGVPGKSVLQAIGSPVAAPAAGVVEASSDMPC